MFRTLLAAAVLLTAVACAQNDERDLAGADPCASGEDALTSGNSDAAIAAFEACLVTAALEPEQEAIIHTRLGGAYLYEDRFEDALQAFNLAYAIAETQGLEFENSYVRRNRGIARLAVGQLDGALTDLEAAVLDLPDDIMTQLNLGRAYSRSEREAEAAAAFDAVTRLEPEWSGGWTNLSGALLELGLNSQAIDHARRAVELEPDSGFTLNGLCWALVVDDQHATALPLCEQAVAAVPDNGAIVHSLASALEGVGRTDEARARFSEAYSLMPESETIEMDYLRTRAEND